MKSMIEYFNTTNYPQNNRYNIPLVNDMPSKRKDEFGAVPLHECVGLRSKVNAKNTVER